MRKTHQDLSKNRRSLDTLDLAHDIYQFIDIATTGKAINQRTEARHKEHHTITAATSIISTLIQVFSLFVYIQTGKDSISRCQSATNS